jgi:F0F1-type ATP synthase epsilon subunit
MLFTILGIREKRELAVTWIDVQTTKGNMVIQRGHAPTLLIVSAGKPLTICDKNGKQETFETPGGILEIKRNEALLLLNE